VRSRWLYVCVNHTFGATSGFGRLEALLEYKTMDKNINDSQLVLAVALHKERRTVVCNKIIGMYL